MNTNDPEQSRLIKVLLFDEGKKNYPYKDTLGNWTIGIGYFIGKNLENLFLSDDIILEMLREKIERAKSEALVLFGSDVFYSWTEARRSAIISLFFNLGWHGFSTFKKMIAAILQNNWEQAAIELKDSTWARQVDPKMINGKGRDDRLSFMFLTGKYPDEYQIVS